MRNPAIWLVVLLLAGDYSRGSDTDPPAKKVITNSVGMKLVRVPAGEFLTGSPEDERGRFASEKQHRVRFTNAFYLGMYEVTAGDFRQFVNDTKYKTDAEKATGGIGWSEPKGNFELDRKYSWRYPGFKQDDNHPVTLVNWNDAVAYCTWLSKLEGRSYRLPTEAEWQYACRAGTTTRFHHGDDAEGLAKVGNVFDASLRQKRPSAPHQGIASNDGYAYTSPVGSFLANAFGLYDMHGNVWEWSADWYVRDDSEISPADDPRQPPAGSFHVFCGGAWNSYARYCRSASSASHSRTISGPSTGFRVALQPAEWRHTGQLPDGRRELAQTQR